MYPHTMHDTDLLGATLAACQICLGLASMMRNEGAGAQGAVVHLAGIRLRASSPKLRSGIELNR